MKTHILMIYPEFPSTYWSLKHALPFIRKKSSIIPLGLLTVASLLPEDYDITVVDMNVKELKRNAINEADLVFISAMIVQKESMDQVVRLCNECHTPVVAGGPYPTSSYEQIAGVDHFVLNEAELTLPEFIKDYEAGHAKSLYTTTEKPDITQTPPPRFDLIDISAYQNMALQNSRGCPFNCEFCDIIELFGRIPRFKDPDQFIKEMDLVYETGFRGSLFIVDDNFIGNKKKVKNLLREIIKWQKEHHHPFSLFTEASIDMSADEELMELMATAGFDMVFVGIETPDAESLKSCQKSQNLRSNLFESVKKIQNWGIEVTGGFIVGFDSDKEDIFDRQINFIQKAGIPIAMVGLLGAMPNTQLYRRLEKEGRLKAGDEWKGNNTHELSMSFTPKMPENILVSGYKKILSEIYSPKKYFDRCFTFIKRLPKGKKNQTFRIRYNEIRALCISFFKQTFSAYGIYYIRFLSKVIIRHGRHFPEAVSFSVKGYHFFKITENIMKADDFLKQLRQTTRYISQKTGEISVHAGRAIIPGAEKFRQQVLHINKNFQKKYNRMNEDIRKHLSLPFSEFESMVQMTLKNLKLYSI